VQVGKLVTDLQARLSAQVHNLEAALAQVRQLQGLLPICAWCKKIRDGDNHWHLVEDYLMNHAEIQFSHGICPDCLREQMGDYSLPSKVTP
jgi:phosphoserine phosphatase RsbU/P